jgi:VCBS repeat-containing protein
MSTDADGDVLTFKMAVQPRRGTVDLDKTSGTFTYRPVKDFHGEDAFSVDATDGRARALASVTVRVTPVDDAPFARALALTATEDASARGKVMALDADGDALTYAVTSARAPMHGAASVDARTGVVTYRPAQDFFGVDAFGVDVSARGARVTADVSVTIAPQNDAPRAQAIELTVAEDGAVDGALASADVDGDALTFTVAVPPRRGTVELDTAKGVLRYQPVKDFHGDDAFTIDTTDGRARAAASVKVRVTPMDDAPVVRPSTLAALEDTSARGTIVAVDADGDALAFTIDPARAPAHGAATVDKKTGAVTYTPERDFHGDDAFAVVVSAREQKATADVSVKVSPVNDPPRAQALELAVVEDGAVDGALASADIDGDALTFKVASPPRRGTIELDKTSGAFRYQSEKDFHGDDAFTIDTTDGGARATAAVRVRVTPVDDAPVAPALALDAVEDVTVKGKVMAVDVDGDLLTFALDSARAPAHGTASVDNKTGAVTYTPARDFHGDDAFGVAVSAGSARATADVTVKVAPKNDAPLPQALELTVVEDGSVDRALASTDVDGDALTFRVATQPRRGSVSIDKTSGALTYQPTKDLHGDDAFAIEASDGRLRSMAAVTVHVTPADDAPVAHALALEGQEDTSARGKIVALDVDGDELTYALDAARVPSHGTASVDATTGAVTYVPAKDFHGNDAFGVQVSARGARATADVSVMVAPVNDAPRAAAIELVVAEDGVVERTLAPTDVDGDALTFKISTQPRRGTVTVDRASGALTYQPAKDFHGTDGFTIDTSDGRERALSTVSVKVTPVDDAPVARALALTAVEDASTRGQVVGLDVDGDTMTYVLDSARAPAHGAVIVDKVTGAVTYTPAHDFFGEDAFGVAVSAGDKRATADVNVTVTPQNDAPLAQALELTVAEDATVRRTLAPTDADGDVLAFKVATQPRRGAVDLDKTSGAFTYQPQKDFHGDDGFTVEATDGRARSLATVTVKVTPVDDAPTARPLALAAAEDASATGKIVALDVDNDPLTYAIDATRAPAHGTANVDPKTGAVTYAPARDFHGDDAFGVNVSAGGAHVASDVTVKVAPQNDTPVAQAIELSVEEDGVGKGALASTDIDGDALTFKVTSQARRGTVVLDEKTGAFTFTPAKDFHGDDVFTVDSSDGRARSTATVRVHVKPVDDAPVARSLALTTVEDTSARGKVVAIDVDNDALTYVLDTARAPKHGEASIDARTGELTYQPARDFFGDDDFAVVVKAWGVPVTADITVTVAPQNDAPHAQAIKLTVAEDAAVDGTLSSTDADGDALTFKIGVQPRRGTVKLDPASGAFSFKPAKDAHGDDAFTIDATDGRARSTATVSVHVTPVDDAPVAHELALNATEDASAKGKITATDADGDALTYALDTARAPAHGAASVDNKTGAVTYTPAKDFHGPDSFAVRVSAGTASVTAAVNVTVAPANDVPYAQDVELTVVEDSTGAGALAATDADGDVLTFKIKAPTPHGTIELDEKTGAFTFKPAKDFFGDAVFTVATSDGGARGASVPVARVTVHVTPVDDAPVARPLDLAATEDATAHGKLAVVDADGDALAFALDSTRAPAHGEVTVDRATGALSYTPARDFHGEDAFVIDVSAGSAHASAQVKVTVAPQNDAPLAQALELLVAEDAVVAGALSAADVDGDALTFKIAVPPRRGTVDLDKTSGAFTYRPGKDFHGDDAVTIDATDGRAKSAATVKVRVTPVDDAPTARPLALDAVEDTLAHGKIAASDVDGDALSYAVDRARAPAHGQASVDANTGVVSYTPARDFHGADAFAVDVSAGGAHVMAEVAVTVAPANDAPTARAIELSVAEDDTLTGAIAAVDADGDALTFKLKTPPKRGTVHVDEKTGAFTFKPAKDFNGDAVFTVDSTDGSAKSSASVTVHVTPIDDGPTARALALVAVEDGSTTAAVDASDVDGDVLTYALDGVRTPAHGQATVDPKTGAVTYKPVRDFHGSDAFSVAVSAAGSHVTAEVNVTVTPANDVPTTRALELTVEEDGTLKNALAATDGDGDVLTFKVATQPRHGTVTLDEQSGAFTYQPARNFHGDDAFTVESSDGRAKSTATVIVHTTPVDDAPVAAALALSAVEDTTAVGKIAAIDADGDALTFGLDMERPPAHGEVAVDARTGAVSYTPARDFHGEDAFGVVVRAWGVRVTADVTVAVAAANDAPLAQALELTAVEDGAVEGALSLTDVDGNPLTFKIKTPTKNGTVDLVEKTGAFTFKPAKDFNGDAVFTVDATDGRATSVSKVTVHVTPVDDAPVAGTLALTTREDAAVTAEVAALDIDSDVLAYALDGARPPAHGEVRVDAKTGGVTYAPARNFHGDDAFAVDVSARGARATANITVKVAPENDAPTAPAMELTVAEDAVVRGALAATDVDGDALTFEIVKGPAKSGTVELVEKTGAFIFKPAADFNGDAMFVIEAIDGSASTPARVTVHVIPVDDAPTARSLSLGAVEDAYVTGRVTATDVDGDEIAYAIDGTGGPAHGTATVDPKTGDVVYTPARDFHGADAFAVDVSALGAHATAQVSVKVAPQNDLPLAQAVELTVAEDGVVQGALSATDIDGDALTFKMRAPAKGGDVTLDEKTGHFTFTPTKDKNGDISFLVDTSDGGGTSTVTVTVHVLPVDDAPVAQAMALDAIEDTPARGRVAASDLDGDALTYALDRASAPAHGEARVDSKTGGVTYTPVHDYFGDDAFAVEVRGGGVRATARVNVKVAPQNDAPVAHPLELTVAEDTAVKGALASTDVDGDALTFKVKAAAKSGTVELDEKTGGFTFVPAKDYHGDAVLKVDATDGFARSTATVTVHVTPVDDPPVARSAALAAVEDTPAQTKIEALDVDGDALTYALDPALSAAHGEVSVDKKSGNITYAPAQNFHGDDAFGVVVHAGGASAAAKVIVKVDAGNDTPVAKAMELVVEEDGAVEGALTGTDIDGDALTFKVATPAKRGSVDLDKKSGAFTFKPAKDVHGDDAFTVEVSDGKASSTAVVSVHITPVNDPPIVRLLALATAEDWPATGKLAVLDAEGDAPAFVLDRSRAPAHGEAAVDPQTGAVTYTPTRDFFGDDAFGVDVTAGGARVAADVHVKVSAVNDPPLPETIDLTVKEDAAVEGALAPTDIDGDVLSFKVKGRAKRGILELDEKTGAFRFTPAKDFYGADVFTINASDGRVTAMTTVTIRVLAVDDGPDPSGMIDRSLSVFETKRNAMLARTHVPSQEWGEAWIRVLSGISSAFEMQPSPNDIAAFVRGRDYLELKLSWDQASGLLLPADIIQRVGVVVSALDESAGDMSVALVPASKMLLPPSAPGSLVVLRAPLGDAPTTSSFGLRLDPITKHRRFHSGIDFGAKTGTKIHAAASGLIVFAGANGGFGKQVVIDHGAGVRSHYSHLSEILVDEGKLVEQGVPIALVGSTGRSTGPHLHFSVTRQGEFIDPSSMMGRPIHRLKEPILGTAAP